MSSQTSRNVGGADGATGHHGGGESPPSGLAARIAFAWTIVGVPLAYGIYETAKKASALFTG